MATGYGTISGSGSRLCCRAGEVRQDVRRQTIGCLLKPFYFVIAPVFRGATCRSALVIFEWCIRVSAAGRGAMCGTKLPGCRTLCCHAHLVDLMTGPSRHFSHGSMFVASRGVERGMGADIRPEFAFDLGRRFPEGAHFGLKPDLPHSSALPIARCFGRGCWANAVNLSSAARRRPERKSASTDRWS